MHDERAVTGLILEVFRLNGSLLAAGDALVSDLGLTSARWQVLGAIALAQAPLPVSAIARNMGLSRQNVQRIVDELAARDWLAFAPNPLHRRAKLVLLTDAGRDLFAAASARQAPWAAGLAQGLSERELSGASDLLRRLRERLESATVAESRVEPETC